MKKKKQRYKNRVSSRFDINLSVIMNGKEKLGFLFTFAHQPAWDERLKSVAG